MNAAIKIGPRGTVTLPVEIRRLYALKPNDLLIAVAREDGIFLRPATVTPTELYSDARIAQFEKTNNRDLADLFPDRRKTPDRA